MLRLCENFSVWHQGRCYNAAMVRHSRFSYPQEAILEFIRQGDYVKVSAVDTATGTEVCIVGAASAPHDYLEELALRKLARRLQQGG